MSITSFSFLILLACTWILYYIVPQKFRWLTLLAGSVVFYAVCGVVPFAIMAVLSASTYFFSRKLEKNNSKLLLSASIGVILLALIAAKYLDFLFGIFGQNQSLNVSILGISFYSFTSISYLVDVYKKKITAQRNFLKLYLYLTFFPHIIQGPIAKYDSLAPQLFEGHTFDYENNVKGVFSIFLGLIKKLIIVDRIGLLVSSIFENNAHHNTIFVLAGGFLYAIQLYLDFSGYMNIAEGTALLFSIKLDKNFFTPYFSRNISDFWRNWHATLGRWLREYIYIPLGGNRKGTFRKYLNLMVVFLVSGIWHGAAWTFVLWGIYHGLLSVIHAVKEPRMKKLRAKLHIGENAVGVVIVQTVLTFAFVCLGWILFRASSLQQAVSMFSGLFKFEGSGILHSFVLLCRESGLSAHDGKIMLPFLAGLVLIEILQYRKVNLTKILFKIPAAVRCIICIILIVLIICFAVQGSTGFMYAVF